MGFWARPHVATSQIKSRPPDYRLSNSVGKFDMRASYTERPPIRRPDLKVCAEEFAYATALELGRFRTGFFLITNSTLTLLGGAPGVVEYSSVSKDPPDTRQPAC